MKLVEIITIIIVSSYLLLMLFYFAKKVQSGEGINSECDECKNKGAKLIKYYYKQKKKECKINSK